MRAAGYDVSTQEFSFPFFEELSQAQFSRISPEPRTFAATDFRTMTFAKAVDVTAAVTPVDVRLPAPGDLDNLSTSGCEANDFTGFPVGNIALVQWGTCAFADKAKISLSLNFDMVGSPNFMRGVYDGDGSSFGLKGPAGSAQIEGCSTSTSPTRAWRSNAPSSPVGLTTRPSSTAASPRVDCSPAPRV